MTTATITTPTHSEIINGVEYTAGINATGRHYVKATKPTPKARFGGFKIIMHYGYNSAEEASAAFDRHTSNAKAAADKVAARKAEHKALLSAVRASDFYKVGDIIENTWGYEQTNTSFYRVMKVTDRTIQIAELRTVSAPGSEGFMCDNVVPSEELNTDPKAEKYTLRVKPGGYLSGGETFFYFHKWSGKASYRSWYA